MDTPNDRMKLSELRDYIESIINDHGDLEVSITLPGWVLGYNDSVSQHHAWNFGLYVLDLGTETGTERVACIGHVGEKPETGRHLFLVKE